MLNPRKPLRHPSSKQRWQSRPAVGFTLIELMVVILIMGTIASIGVSGYSRLVERARIVELRFFGGLSNAEAGEILGVSTRSVERAWRVARAWLLRELGASDAST